MVQADEDISKLNADARKVQYDADCLALARDLAQVANLYKEIMKSQQAERQERIVHLRGQNLIGASLVSDFMSNNLAIHSGNPKELISLAERVSVGKQLFHMCFLSIR